MKNFWQVVRGLVIALASVGLLFGGLSLSLAEQPLNIPPTPTGLPSGSVTHQATLTPTSTLFILAGDTSTAPSPSLTSTALQPTLTSTFTSTLTPPPPPTNCPPPGGWVPYYIKSGDTLTLLARHYGISLQALKQGNCLVTDALIPGTILYVPPSPTQTRIPCGPPAGWILAVVQPGDTLFRLSQAYGITVAQLQSANCMGTSTLLRVGESISVPPWAPHTPTPSFPMGDTPTYIPTDTISDITPTETLYIIPSTTPTDTRIPTETPSP